MARAGLGPNWNCLFANDNDQAKADIYAANWGQSFIHRSDVADIKPQELAGTADLAWASFPCQDLSLAGNGAGLSGDRSSAFWHFWRLVTSKTKSGNTPKLIVLENVMGAVTSHKGDDFRSICEAFHSAGYRFGAIMLDASDFLPQSRRRLFFLGVREDLPIPERLLSHRPTADFHTNSIVAAADQLISAAKKSWVWWAIGSPSVRSCKLADYLGSIDDTMDWHSDEKTRNLISLMDDNNRLKLEKAKLDSAPQIGAIYKRMRKDKEGKRIQRAEVRFDGLVGCLRVPLGGSSKQTLIFVDQDQVRTRLLSPRESASLMGLDDNYILPSSATETYHLSGDGVAVPVVSFLRDRLIEPLLCADGADLDLTISHAANPQFHHRELRAEVLVSST